MWNLERVKDEVIYTENSIRIYRLYLCDRSRSEWGCWMGMDCFCNFYFSVIGGVIMRKEDSTVVAARKYIAKIKSETKGDWPDGFWKLHLAKRPPKAIRGGVRCKKQ